MGLIEFQGVSKVFRVGRPWGIKEAVLRHRGQRPAGRLVEAVRGVTFRIDSGESVALLGPNGSGKSTCLKLLAQTIAPTSGSISVGGRVAPLLELGAGFHSDLTGRENVLLTAALLGLRRSAVTRALPAIVDFAGIGDFIDSPLRLYSSGMAARLGFAIAVHVDAEIILVDEVLAVGDANFQQKCLERMKDLRDEGRTVVLVTHALTQAQDFCSRALVVSNGQLVFDGPMPAAREAYFESMEMPDPLSHEMGDAHQEGLYTHSEEPKVAR